MHAVHILQEATNRIMENKTFRRPKVDGVVGDADPAPGCNMSNALADTWRSGDGRVAVMERLARL